MLYSFDGCSATCQLEPSCPGTTGCTSSCGDGIVLGANEQCDDGNLRNGDGCSSTPDRARILACASNPCVKAANGTCTLTVAGYLPRLGVKQRSCFNAADALHGADGKNPDFEPSYDNQPAITGLLATTLGTDGVPVLAARQRQRLHSQRCVVQPVVPQRGAQQRDRSRARSYSGGRRAGTGAGPYVNRWGANGGEPWPAYTNIAWCANPAAGAMLFDVHCLALARYA